jgi:hypothetical protein
VRRRIAHDSATIAWYAALLEGRATIAQPWDTVEVLRWLADSRSPRYIPLLLRFSLDTSEAAYVQGSVAVTTIGLSYHARRSSAARNRLIELARLPYGSYAQAQGLFALLYLNDEPARAELRRHLPRLRADMLPFGYRNLPRLIRLALGEPPCPPDRYFEEWYGYHGDVHHGCTASWYWP